MTDAPDSSARLLDLEELRRLKARYCRFVDLHWWAELRQLFCDDALVDIPELWARPRRVDAFIAIAREHLDDAVSVHIASMPELTFVGPDGAHGIWAMTDRVHRSARQGGPVIEGAGHYTERYRRVNGEWRVASMRLTRLVRSVDGARTHPAPGDTNGRRPF